MTVDLTTITVDDFKAQFFREFPYTPLWVNTETYNINDDVLYDVNSLFYKCLNDGVTSIPTTATDWSRQVDLSKLDYIQDRDITNAFAESMLSFNRVLFDSDDNIILGYLYLTAHFLVNDIKAASNGIDSRGVFPVASHSAGSVSESFIIPERYSKSTILSFYTSSSYGLKYLNMILPYMVGNIAAVEGQTNA